MTDSRPRILCVDDEAQVLEGIKLNLRKQFDIQATTDGRHALEILLRDGPFAVIISDLRMPNLSGVEVLAEAARRAPHTVRMMLTGQADLPTAMAAINDGRIFRLLLKPCPPQNLAEAIALAADHYRQQAEERSLAQATLMGGINALTGTLALSRPAALNRAKRVRDHAAELAADRRLPERWSIEIAAMLSQLGAVALPPEIARKVYDGLELNEREQAAADTVTLVAAKLIASLPRTEEIRRFLESINLPAGGLETPQGKRIPPIGAQVLRVCVDYDQLVVGGLPPMDAICEMSFREGAYETEVLGRFSVLRRNELSNMESAEMLLMSVSAGMMLGEELRLTSGHVLAPRGMRITDDLLQQMRTILGMSPTSIVRVMRRTPAKAA
ncbi:response regulator [Myxococcota bacterium]|nr:response regulator [Myxococcota bacterium]